jgi:DNA-binding NtrC family response regulator
VTDKKCAAIRNPRKEREQGFREDLSMKDPGLSSERKVTAPTVLLFTRDVVLDQCTAQSLDTNGVVYSVDNTNDALQIICTRGDELDFAIIDFEDGCHGMTLLKAINACRSELPILVVTHGDSEHAAALAYANGAAACLARPFTSWTLAETIKQCCGTEHHLALTT